MNSISNWKKWGKQDPYYGVLSEEKYRTRRMREKDLEGFFKTGESFVQDTEKKISKLFGLSLTGCSILDFGCGVGRLAIPFARFSANQVVGLDVSPEVIDIARSHIPSMEVKNLDFMVFDGQNLPELPQFDFINSYIVFQHIETSLGYTLLHQLLGKLKPGGIIQVHITYGHSLPKLSYWNFFLRGKLPLYNFLYSFLKNRNVNAEPIMQMNHYSPQKLFGIFSKHSNNIQVELTNHGGHLGAIYLLRKEF